MKKILLISRSWPPKESSGVSLAAKKHAQLLLSSGFEVTILGATDQIDQKSLALFSPKMLAAKGSGALYSPARINKQELRDVIFTEKPNLVLIEAWQTALTDASIEVASELDLPVLMVSHGISIHPFTHSVKQMLRSLAWLPYRLFKLPRLIKKLSAITALDLKSKSNRFFDRDLAQKMNVPIFVLKNSPMNWSDKFIQRPQRRRQILLAGYYSPIKNQMAAIKLICGLSADVSLCFVGKRVGSYFDRCQQATLDYGLSGRVKFLQDDECDLGLEIASSLLVFLPSTTEALPTVLIEALACGTPFVATPVGAVPNLKGGITAHSLKSQLEAVNLLMADDHLWSAYSDAGIKQYQEEFSEVCIKDQLITAAHSAINNHLNQAKKSS